MINFFALQERRPPPPEPAQWCAVGEGVFRCETCGAETPAAEVASAIPLYGFIPLLTLPWAWWNDHENGACRVERPAWAIALEARAQTPSLAGAADVTRGDPDVGLAAGRPETSGRSQGDPRPQQPERACWSSEVQKKHRNYAGNERGDG